MNTYFYIKRTALLFLLGFVWNTTLTQAQCPTIIWQDEFNSTQLDASKWNVQLGDGCAEGICGWGNGELQSYNEANITVSDGTLKITSKVERTRGSRYTSGRINTKGKASFAYGRIEASIKLPVGDGLWPAFWMLPTDEVYGSWPQSGEVDIMEFTASRQKEVYGYIHYGDLYPNNQSQGSIFDLKQGVFPDQFHEFAIEWEPGEIRWYVDGILYSTKKPEDLAPYQWPFDQDFYLLLNVAVGGNLGGNVNDSMLPATMEVDYVRVYDGVKTHITGNDVVSNQASQITYTLNNLSPGTSVNWTVPTGATVVSGQGSASVVIDFGSESGVVSASFNNGCEPTSLGIFVEVEPPYVKDFSFENFDTPAAVSFTSATGNLLETNNPSQNGINTSSLSGKYTRNSTEQYDLITYDITNVITGTPYLNKEKKFYVDVYTQAPVGTEIIIQLETNDAIATNYPVGRHSRYVAQITQQNAWQRLEFSLLDTPDPGADGSALTKMIILLNPNSFTSDVYYYDNLDSYNADTGTTVNQAPTVSMTSPNDGASFSSGSTIDLTANANDIDGSIAEVSFFDNDVLIGSDTTAPYSISWNISQGTHTITAKATDNENLTTTSTPITITGTTTGTATTFYVASIVTGEASAQKGQKIGTATVNLKDDLGGVVSNATVSGQFSGTFNEQVQATTDGNGNAYFQTSQTAKGTLTVQFCVSDAQYTGLTFSPLNDGTICSLSARTGSNTDDLEEVLLNQATESVPYPNPMATSFTYQLPENNRAIFSFEIVSLSGKIITSWKNVTSTKEYNVSYLKKGIYILNVYTDSGLFKQYKMVKK
ncbi:family 16 glycosylhydrolase [Tenacibaculum tangerinum]|uniref:Family 16 glycosylhydrolase n=1 Tax=Tenacibaculum tangerinum TaxID=3038772 RepID=A0ABY8KZ46_9FLAO|nr:family 16 glycosylhydrolase [Tenacibaculum tangerinum]WGH74502.1 family 16 glycosylhydrolase [Tenacibaculum tangerinum]